MAKKGCGAGGSGGRWPAVNPKKDLQINRLKGTHLLTVAEGWWAMNFDGDGELRVDGNDVRSEAFASWRAYRGHPHPLVSLPLQPNLADPLGKPGFASPDLD